MRVPIRYLFLLIPGLYGQVSGQSKKEPIPLPFAIQSPTGMLAADSGSTASQSFAVKGRLAAAIHVRRQLSGDLNIVSFRSIAEKKQFEKEYTLVPVNDLWKLSPSLLAGISTFKPEEPVSLLLTVSDPAVFASCYGASPLVRIEREYAITGSLQVTAPVSWIGASALKDTNIQFIATVRKPVTERELTGFDLSANRVNAAHRWWPSINGRGLAISIKENKMDTADIDLIGRYLLSPSASGTMQTHATTMATIAAGAGNTFYTGKGVAWGSSVSSSDFANLLPDKLPELQQLKVSVQNHSYGVGIENYYGADAAAHDAQVVQYPQLIHVFSAGNSGTQPGSGNYAGINGFANLTGSFKMAKNILTVGAMDSFGVIAPLSSRGPAYDGRVKPELVALGEDGSSGASAIVSGMALLIQHAWQSTHAVLPAASVTKSILLNSAVDAGPPGVDFISGYGSANALGALETVMQDRVVQGAVSQGETITHPISIPSNARNLKVTLCWTDPPAQTNSFKALVNDLDLQVFHPGTAQLWLPWVLNSSASPDSLQQLPLRKRDSLNPAEQVTIEVPPAGNFQLMVKGSAVGAQQSYAIAWQYDTLEHFAFTWPVKGDQLLPRQIHTLRWKTTLPGTGTIQYRLNAGNWTTAAAGIDLSKNYHRWQAPDTLGALQFRLLAGSQEWTSDTVGLSPLLLPNTGFNCVDSFLIYWQRAGIDSFRVYRLGQQYLEPFAVVKDTALIQLHNNNPYRFFSVAPVLPFNTEGIRAYTFDYTQQQVACYLSGFIADPYGTTGARLALHLGTTYQVARIVYEKLTANGFVTVISIAPVIAKEQTVTVPATKGLNTYRARVELQNGQVLYTQPEQVLVFADQPYYIFPNPVKQGAPLRLMAADTDDTVFLLYDLLGRKLAEFKVNGFYNEVRLPQLQKGVYYYVVQKAGARQLAQALIVF